MDLLNNPIKAYDWGSRTAIAELTGRPAPALRPEAEMWLGAHPSGPSLVTRDGVRTSLDELIARDPGGELGAATLDRFGARLPYLLKLIAVQRPLSLQVHPSAEQAAEGFAAGRCTDPFAKPELIYALTTFSALAGFRPVAEAAGLLDTLVTGAPGTGIPGSRTQDTGPQNPAVPAERPGRVEPTGHTSPGAGTSQAVREVTAGMAGAAALLPMREALAADDRRAALRAMLECPIETLPALLGRCADLAVRRPGEPAYALVVDLAARYPRDPACLAPLLLRHHVLRPGQALFLGAGVLHCYLSGFGAEIMGGSDNVVRAGLTTKAVDVPELLRIVEPAAFAEPVVAAARAGGGGAFLSPCPEFRLGVVSGPGAETGETFAGGAPRILLCTEGVIVAETASARRGLRPGESVFVPAAAGEVRVSGTGTVLCAEPGEIAAAGGTGGGPARA